MGFIPDDYETVADRLKRWWVAYPEGCILTTMVHYDSKTVVFRAEGYADANSKQPIASGYAEEVLGSSPVNKTSFVENCETSAIGRMISNSPIGITGQRPSREEMQKVARVAEVFTGATVTNHGASAALATDPQKKMLRALARALKRDLPDLDQIGKREASQMIEQWKAEAGDSF